MTWMGIFPLASLAMAFLFPLLTALPFILRMMVLTVLIVFAMYWIVMPPLLRWLAWWLKR